MSRQWTLALEDEIRRTVFEGQLCLEGLEDLLPDEGDGPGCHVPVPEEKILLVDEDASDLR